MADLLIAASINSKIYYDKNPKIFDDMTTKKLLDIRAIIRNEYQTIIVGANTIKYDNPTLLNTEKNNIRIIIDKYADLNIDSKIFRIMPNKTYILLLKKNKEYQEKLMKIGVNVIYLKTKNEKQIIKEIKKISKGNILIEGGAKTICSFLKNNFIENIKIVQFPVILPSKSLGFEQINDFVINCKLNDSYVIENNYIYLCYKVVI